MTSFAEEPTRSLTADGLLARAYLDGDESAFDELYRRYHGDVLRIVRANVRDHALAEDIAQEAFSRAVRYLRTYDPTQPFWPWIRKIARGVTSSELTRRANEVPVEELPRGGTTPDIAEKVALQAAVTEALRLLPKRQARALELRYIEDRDAAYIATLFGLSRNALEQLLLRARTGFAKEYRSRNVAVVPVFGPFVARLRRLVAALDARLQNATGMSFSVAGDVALGAAITVGGIGVVALGGGFADPLPTPKATVAGPADTTKPYPVGSLARPRAGAPVGPAGVIGPVGDRLTTVHVRAAESHGVVPETAPGYEPPAMVQTEPEAAPSAEPSAAPTTAPGGGDELPEVRVVPPTTTPSQPDEKAEGSRGDVNLPVETPSPSPPPASEPSPSDPPVKEPPDDPVPEPSIWVDDERARAVIHDESSNTTGEASAEKDPTKEGAVANSGTKTQVAGQDVDVSVKVTNSDDGSVGCYAAHLLCK